MSDRIDRVFEVDRGQVWCRDPDVHTMRESFSCTLDREKLPHSGPSGPWLELGCYAMVIDWWDEARKSDDNSWSEPGRSRGYRRWYHLLGYGWIHESNLFGFFRRIV